MVITNGVMLWLCLACSDNWVERVNHLFLFCNVLTQFITNSRKKGDHLLLFYNVSVHFFIHSRKSNPFVTVL